MATLSSHLLNSVNGTHAGGVKVIIYQINSSSNKKIFFETETDDGGRIIKDFELSSDIVIANMKWFAKQQIIFLKKKLFQKLLLNLKWKILKKNIIYQLLYLQMVILFGGLINILIPKLKLCQKI